MACNFFSLFRTGWLRVSWFKTNKIGSVHKAVFLLAAPKMNDWKMFWVTGSEQNEKLSNSLHKQCACMLSLSHTHTCAYKKQFTRSQSMNSSSFIMTNLFRHPNSNTCLRCTDDTWTFSAQIFQTFTAGFLQNTRHSTPFETY